jgi:hypothetical protein
MKIILPTATIAAAIAMVVALSACSSHEEHVEAPAEVEPVAAVKLEPAPVGMPNPAAVFCVDSGGETVMRTNDDGSIDGYCKLADGGYIEQWELYRAEHHRAKANMANPAAVFCSQQGGMLERKTIDEEVTTYCNLPDGSAVEQWQYFRDNHPQN